MAGIDRQGVVGLNGTVSQHVPMYMNMYLSVKICGGLNTVSANIASVDLHLTFKPPDGVSKSQIYTLFKYPYSKGLLSGRLTHLKLLQRSQTL